MKQIINQHNLLHCLHSYLPAYGIKIPSIVTIHDLKYLRFPEFFDNRLKYIYYKWIIRRSVLKARRIISISHATKKDIEYLLGISSDKITVIGEAITVTVDVKIHSELPKVLQRKPFLLYVGMNRPNKNCPRIIEAHQKLLNILGDKCPFLVFVGVNFDALCQKYSSEENIKKLIFLGQVSEEILITLYKHAIALVYPSLYEGFGLPVLEAMAMGTPVIASNCASMPEVAGKAAILIDPYNINQLVDAIIGIINDRSEREKLRYLGLCRAKKFSWEKIARMILYLYEECL